MVYHNYHESNLKFVPSKNQASFSYYFKPSTRKRQDRCIHLEMAALYSEQRESVGLDVSNTSEVPGCAKVSSSFMLWVFSWFGVKNLAIHTYENLNVKQLPSEMSAYI